MKILNLFAYKVAYEQYDLFPNIVPWIATLGYMFYNIPFSLLLGVSIYGALACRYEYEIAGKVRSCERSLGLVDIN